MSDRRLLSVVVPVYNEETAVAPFCDAIVPVLQALPVSWELIFVSDGCTDRTIPLILERQKTEPRLRLIELARHYGKESALTAGLDLAQGDAVVPIDVDLQDPPELIAQMVALWQEGYEVVHATRRSRGDDSWGKRAGATLFYGLFNRLTSEPIPRDTGDFRLMDRCVIEAVRQFRERNRFMKGIFAEAGFRQTQLVFDRPGRAHGRTKWSTRRLFGLGVDAIASYSIVPLRVWSLLGLLIALGALGYAGYVAGRVLIFGRELPGHASVMVALLVLGGLNMMSIGMLGEYVGRIYLEVKQRPIYIVRKIHG